MTMHNPLAGLTSHYARAALHPAARWPGGGGCVHMLHTPAMQGRAPLWCFHTSPSLPRPPPLPFPFPPSWAASPPRLIPGYSL